MTRSDEFRFDRDRVTRTGCPELIYAPGKSVDQLRRIIDHLASVEWPLVVSRIAASLAHELGAATEGYRYLPSARLLWLNPSCRRLTTRKRPVGVLTAGSADVPIAEEAAALLEIFGYAVERWYDVGVAGLERLLERLPEIRRASPLIVVAGMDGALPSVTAGLVAAPVIAVPTSIGHGASFQGIGPLLTMLASCAPGVSVVNIDGGISAALMTHKICASTETDG
ncbi:MAG: nickel pincer cofactor biosynthesis protein LarB [Myxococcales bacterium]|nr:nickel pincer cofactor biosynthesis protein LarB [Myxococcales bacterium]